MSKKVPEVVFRAKAKDGKLLIANIEHLGFYCIEHEDEDLLIHIEPEAQMSAKLKMYAYWYCNILNCAVIGYTYAGYEGVDKVKADYLLRSEFAKDFIRKPNGEYVPIMLDKRNMTKARLFKLMQDAIFFIETELQVIVPDSETYKLKQQTGRDFKKMEQKEP